MPPTTFLIERIILLNHRQFSHCDIDLCHPVTGEVLQECCFIGANGTGKSELLKNLYHTVSPSSECPERDPDALVLAKVRTEENSYYQLHKESGDKVWYHDSLENDTAWTLLMESPLNAEKFEDAFQNYHCDFDGEESESDVFTAFFSSTEALMNGELADNFSGFLEGLIRERESEFFSFLKMPVNRLKTVTDAEIDFMRASPNQLAALKEIWDKVLGQAALVFDLESQGKLVSSKTGTEVEFSKLSQGMQHFLLRIGQVFCRYYQKENQSGFLFLDEPETSLHPQLQFNYINLYRSIICNHPTQLFVSTHSPLIATQFPDYSRILLQFDHDGSVQVSRGIAQEGSDPNQMLIKDFGLKTVHPKRTHEQAGQYSKLKRAIRESGEEEEDELADLIDQVMTIRRY